MMEKVVKRATKCIIVFRIKSVPFSKTTGTKKTLFALAATGVCHSTMHFLPQMGFLIVHASSPATHCLIRVDGVRTFHRLRPLLSDCQFIFLSRQHLDAEDSANLLMVVWQRNGVRAFVHFWVEVESVYLGAFIARRIQRAWRRHVVCCRRTALCMASHSRLGTSPLLDAVLSALCAEDLARIV